MIVNELPESEINKINKQLIESLENYRKTIDLMLTDAPIEVLNLPNSLNKILINEGCLRVYDLFNRDLTKIKGIGKTRIRDLSTRLQEFIPMRC